MLEPNKIAEKAVEVGKTKANLPVLKMLVLGILAGMFIALAGAGSSLGNIYGGKIASALIFPIGLIMVIVAGSELFTGNNLMVMSLIHGKITVGKLLRNWFIVFFGNFLGALIVAFFVIYSGVFDQISESVIATATTKVNLDFLEAIIRGVLCNFLVCIAVWMAFGAKTIAGKILALFGPIFLFVLCGFEHSIANMFYGPAGIFAALKNGIIVENLNFGIFITNNLIPVTLGNIIGGAGIISCFYYLVYLTNKK